MNERRAGLDHEVMMLKIGTTTIPLAGWGVGPRRPEQGQKHRLGAIRHIVEEYGMSAVELNQYLGIVHPRSFL